MAQNKFDRLLPCKFPFCHVVGQLARKNYLGSTPFHPCSSSVTLLEYVTSLAKLFTRVLLFAEGHTTRGSCKYTPDKDSKIMMSNINEARTSIAIRTTPRGDESSETQLFCEYGALLAQMIFTCMAAGRSCHPDLWRCSSCECNARSLSSAKRIDDRGKCDSATLEFSAIKTQ